MAAVENAIKLVVVKEDILVKLSKLDLDNKNNSNNNTYCL